MIKFGVVEDSSEAAEKLKSYIEKYAAEFDCEISVDMFSNADAFLEKYERGTDVVFMDIDLPGENGMSAAGKLRRLDGDVLIIFVTNLAQYAVDGYSVRAFDFMVKPVTYPNFVMKLRRALDCIMRNRGKEICVTTRSGKKLLNVADIEYIEVMKHVITYHTASGKTVGSGTLKSVCENLVGQPFSMCNRCYLVNLRYVTEINGNSVTVGGDILQISAPRRKKFLASFNEFLGVGGNTE